MHSDPLLVGNPPLTRITPTHTHADRGKHTKILSTFSNSAASHFRVKASRLRSDL